MNFLKKTPSVKLIFGLYILDLILAYLDIWGFVGLISFLDHWQVLVGAFLGAATPVSLYLLQQQYEQKKRRKDFLLLLEKNINSAINNLISIDVMLHGFLEDNLERYKAGVIEDDTAGRYSVGQAFIPLSMTFTFDKELLKGTTDSNYLEGLMSDVISSSLSFPFLLEDINRQFDRTINLNTQIGILKLNPASIHNKILLDNLEEFRSFLNSQTFEQNIPIYLRKLVSFEVALGAMSRWGLKKWAETFPSFPPSMNAQERGLNMDNYFKEEVNVRIKEYQKEFKTNELLVGEDTIHI